MSVARRRREHTDSAEYSDASYEDDNRINSGDDDEGDSEYDSAEHSGSDDLSERESGDGQAAPGSQKSERIDDDEDKRNPQYIPKRGTFYEHDDRTALGEEENEVTEDVDNSVKGVTSVNRDVLKVSSREKSSTGGSPTNLTEKKPRQSRANAADKWTHDKFNENDQTPKSSEELVSIYGYDIRAEEGPPRAFRRRKYGRGPNKYTRNWEDEKAYGAKTTPIKTRTPPQVSNGEEFPSLQSSTERTRGGNRRRNGTTRNIKQSVEPMKKQEIDKNANNTTNVSHADSSSGNTNHSLPEKVGGLKQRTAGTGRVGVVPSGPLRRPYSDTKETLPSQNSPKEMTSSIQKNLVPPSAGLPSASLGGISAQEKKLASAKKLNTSSMSARMHTLQHPSQQSPSVSSTQQTQQVSVTNNNAVNQLNARASPPQQVSAGPTQSSGQGPEVAAGRGKRYSSIRQRPMPEQYQPVQYIADYQSTPPQAQTNQPQQQQQIGSLPHRQTQLDPIIPSSQQQLITQQSQQLLQTQQLQQQIHQKTPPPQMHQTTIQQMQQIIPPAQTIHQPNPNIIPSGQHTQTMHQATPSLHQTPQQIHQISPSMQQIHQANPTLHQTATSVHQSSSAMLQTNPQILQTNPTIHQTSPAIHQPSPQQMMQTTAPLHPPPANMIQGQQIHQQSATLINQQNATLINQQNATLINQQNATLINQQNATLINQPNTSLHQRSPSIHQASPTLHQASPTLHQPSPTLHQASPTLHQASPTLHQASAPLHQSNQQILQNNPPIHQVSPPVQPQMGRQGSTTTVTPMPLRQVQRTHQQMPIHNIPAPTHIQGSLPQQGLVATQTYPAQTMIPQTQYIQNNTSNIYSHNIPPQVYQTQQGYAAPPPPLPYHHQPTPPYVSSGRSVYREPSGITFYSPQEQKGPTAAPPTRRPTNAIPIVPPPSKRDRDKMSEAAAAQKDNIDHIVDNMFVPRHQQPRNAARRLSDAAKTAEPVSSPVESCEEKAKDGSGDKSSKESSIEPIACVYALETQAEEPIAAVAVCEEINEKLCIVPETHHEQILEVRIDNIEETVGKNEEVITDLPINFEINEPKVEDTVIMEPSVAIHNENTDLGVLVENKELEVVVENKELEVENKDVEVKDEIKDHELLVENKHLEVQDENKVLVVQEENKHLEVVVENNHLEIVVENQDVEVQDENKSLEVQDENKGIEVQDENIVLQENEVPSEEISTKETKDEEPSGVQEIPVEAEQPTVQVEPTVVEEAIAIKEEPTQAPEETELPIEAHEKLSDEATT